MTRRRTQAVPVPASVTAVALVAEAAQAKTGQPMSETELCELLTQARDMEYRRILEQPHTPPPPNTVHWSPAASAGLRGHTFTGPAAEAFNDLAHALAAAEQESTP